MRVRYTEPAARELDAGISYFLEHAPSVVVDFADSIDRALTRLLDHPYSAEETKSVGFAGYTSADFVTRSSILSRGTTS